MKLLVVNIELIKISLLIVKIGRDILSVALERLEQKLSNGNKPNPSSAISEQDDLQTDQAKSQLKTM